MLAADADAIGFDLPCAAYVGVDDRVGTAPIGRTRCCLNELLCLDREQRQCNCPDAIDLETRGRKLDATRDEVVARPVHLAEYIGKLLRDGHCASWPGRLPQRMMGR